MDMMYLGDGKFRFADLPHNLVRHINCTLDCGVISGLTVVSTHSENRALRCFSILLYYFVEDRPAPVVLLQGYILCGTKCVVVAAKAGIKDQSRTILPSFLGEDGDKLRSGDFVCTGATCIRSPCARFGAGVAGAGVSRSEGTSSTLALAPSSSY